MVMRTRLNVTLYGHFLPCLFQTSVLHFRVFKQLSNMRLTFCSPTYKRNLPRKRIGNVGGQNQERHIPEGFFLGGGVRNPAGLHSAPQSSRQGTKNSRPLCVTPSSLAHVVPQHNDVNNFVQEMSVVLGHLITYS